MLDEADRMLNIGFLPGHPSIVASFRSSANTALLGDIVEEIEALSGISKNPESLRSARRHLPSNRSLIRIEVSKEASFPAAPPAQGQSARLRARFSRTKHGADKIAANSPRLESHPPRCLESKPESAHSGPQGIQSGAVARARGDRHRRARIDVEESRHVVTFDFPRSLRNYVNPSAAPDA